MRCPHTRGANIDQGRAGQTTRKRDWRPITRPRCESSGGSAATEPARSASASASGAS
jgi:hypothetical protein